MQDPYTDGPAEAVRSGGIVRCNASVGGEVTQRLLYHLGGCSWHDGLAVPTISKEATRDVEWTIGEVFYMKSRLTSG